MKSAVLLLVLLSLPALSITAICDASIVGCSSCATTAAGSDCNFCKDGYYKSSTTACTACPQGTGRFASTTTTDIETTAVCNFDWAPQLNCLTAGGTYSCSTCPTGTYREAGGLLFDTFSANGCSADCKSFAGARTTVRILPKTVDPPATSCASCRDGCTKCEFADATMRSSAGSQAGSEPQLTKCTECINGYYVLLNAADPTIVPTCAPCGANCKKCKDNTQCDECFAGWALDGTNKRSCLKKVAISAASIVQITLLCLSALLISW